MSPATRVVVSRGTGVDGFELEQSATGGHGPFHAIISICACAGLIALAGARQGTTIGGEYSMLLGRLPSGLSSEIRDERRASFISRRIAAARVIPATRTASQEVKLIRRSFSLTMQQVADLAGVTRAVAHRWREAQSTPRPAHRKRLAVLARIAQEWSATGRAPVGLDLYVPVLDGRSVMDLLARDPIPETQIASLISRVAASRTTQTPVLNLEEVFATHGMRPSVPDMDAVEREDRGLSLGNRSHSTHGA
jgi:DNA-binding transcriptional regulator YiaG